MSAPRDGERDGEQGGASGPEAGPQAGQVAVRDAASVLLVRDITADGGAQATEPPEPGIEVFVQQRAARMVFAAGMTVFPGGGVDPADAEADIDWRGPPPQDWAAVLDCELPTARALVCAAVRETFEESGVLLAAHTSGELVTSTTAYNDARRALVAREVSLAGFLAAEGLVLRADLLRAWAHWLTPDGEPRRYDTRFFVAELPRGQYADGATSEAHSTRWQRPQALLAQLRAGECKMLPPTAAALSDLAEVGSVSAAMSVARRIIRVTPRLVADGDGTRVVIDEAAAARSVEAAYAGPVLAPQGQPAQGASAPGETAKGQPGQERPTQGEPLQGEAAAGEASGGHPAYGRLRRAGPLAGVVLEPNPSEMTLEGTNSWVLRHPEAAMSVVVDPGEDDPEHLRALAAAAGQVELVLLTHHHHDHAAGTYRFTELVHAPVRAFDPQLCRAGPALTDGEVLHAAGLEFRVLHTPGHTADSVSFVVHGPGADRVHVCTGDTVLGRGTTVLSDLGGYLDSLGKLAQLPDDALGLPGHGAELAQLGATVQEYLEHRLRRLDQVRGALGELGQQASAREVVEQVYADVDPSLWQAAEVSVRAQLEYLRREP